MQVLLDELIFADRGELSHDVAAMPKVIADGEGGPEQITQFRSQHADRPSRGSRGINIRDPAMTPGNGATVKRARRGLNILPPDQRQPIPLLRRNPLGVGDSTPFEPFPIERNGFPGVGQDPIERTELMGPNFVCGKPFASLELMKQGEDGRPLRDGIAGHSIPWTVDLGTGGGFLDIRRSIKQIGGGPKKGRRLEFQPEGRNPYEPSMTTVTPLSSSVTV